jgi:hypothetical protein
MATIEQIESSLPNGFHDALLLRLSIDYRIGEAVIGIDVVVNDERIPEYREGLLRISGVHFLVVDAPGPVILNSPRQSRIDAGPGHPSRSTINLPSVPSGHFLHWFFVNDWNAFIRVAARDATFEWVDEISPRHLEPQDHE